AVRVRGGVMPVAALPPLAGERLARFEAFVERLRPVFPRADQFRRCRAYLRGLMEPIRRKNVEGLAEAAKATDEGATRPDYAQALQHFVSHSPWDAGRLLARYRELLPAAARGNPGTWVVHDGVIPKKGRHSVGTQRQFARPLGRKVNCQVAVVVGRDGPGGYLPLAVRLYLPGYWLREQKELAEKTVPAEFRGHATKAQIAAGLVAELVREGWTADGIAADPGYGTGGGEWEKLGVNTLEGRANEDVSGRAGGEWGRLAAALGFDHFEGRAWLGWHHHVALVLAAVGFLANEPAEHQ
ncbi:MAG: transposase, partial [Gemmataceae bacterium]|nr:transposase [Gemmataceae bacterium]